MYTNELKWNQNKQINSIFLWLVLQDQSSKSVGYLILETSFCRRSDKIRHRDDRWAFSGLSECHPEASASFQSVISGRNAGSEFHRVNAAVHPN